VGQKREPAAGALLDPSGRLINFGASWPDFCARRDDTLFTSDNVTSFGSGFGLAA